MSASGNGFRQEAAPSKKEQFRQVTTELKNLSMAMRISQMMLQKLATDSERLDKDMARAMGLLNDLQYRTLATIEVGNFDKDALDTRADELKLTDYNSASDKDDAAKGLVAADVVTENSTVILTSIAPEEQGIFRSKFKVTECGLPELQKTLVGKKVGDKFSFTVGAVEHLMEVVGVREELPKAETTPVDATGLTAVTAEVTADAEVADKATA